MINQLAHYSALVIFFLPLLSLAILISNRLILHKISERLVTQLIIWSQSISLICLGLVGLKLLLAKHPKINFFQIDLINFGQESLSVGFLVDSLAFPFLCLIVLLGAIVGIFASRYLHRDPGYFRFFILYHFFLFGMMLIILSGNLTGIFIGWEIVGLTSALLIAFFAFRKQTVNNSLRAFWAYRVTDTGLLLASLITLHLGISKISDLNQLHSEFYINAVLGLCLLSAMGKSAQFPFGHWLPRAMEGPTPSSAIFYGGLAVHCGIYLILRVTDVLGVPLWFSLCLITIGLLTAIYGTLLAKIQSDAKSTLAFSAMTQVGLMFVEIGLGWKYIALTHLVGHALLRTYQLLNAASLLHDYQTFQHTIGQYQPKKAISANSIWSKIYPVVFWENYSGFSDKWSVLKIMENVSFNLRAFDQRCNELLSQIFQSIFSLLFKSAFFTHRKHK